MVVADAQERIEAGTGKIPRHVAIIMDGNGRCANSSNLISMNLLPTMFV